MEDAERIGRLNRIFHAVTGRSINMKTFDERILFQKVIYSLDSVGISLGYSFSWYIRGPYSAALASDGFRIVDGKEKGSDYALSGAESATINKIRKEFPEMATEQSELYASILFFARQGKAPGAISDEVAALKPWCSKAEVVQATDKLRGSALFSQIFQ